MKILAFRFICGLNIGFEFGSAEEDFYFSLYLGIIEFALLKE
jgi:hypothetical protein